MVRAYFDTTVWSGIANNHVSSADEVALRQALASGKITAPGSLVNIEELLGELETDRRAAIEKLAAVRDREGFRGLLKPPSAILGDAIQAYAAGEDSPPVALPEDQRRLIVTYLADVIAGSRRHDEELREVLVNIDGLKERWVTTMREAQEQALANPAWASLSVQERQAQTFPEFFASAAPEWAYRFARRPGCADECRQRGLDGLLALRPVRLAVGMAMSQMYAELVGAPGQRELRRPDRGDHYDLWHAITASTADVFVTFDRRLADHVERIPDVKGLGVARSLAELLEAAEV